MRWLVRLHLSPLSRQLGKNSVKATRLAHRGPRRQAPPTRSPCRCAPPSARAWSKPRQAESKTVDIVEVACSPNGSEEIRSVTPAAPTSHPPPRTSTPTTPPAAATGRCGATAPRYCRTSHSTIVFGNTHAKPKDDNSGHRIQATHSAVSPQSNDTSSDVESISRNHQACQTTPQRKLSAQDLGMYEVGQGLSSGCVLDVVESNAHRGADLACCLPTHEAFSHHRCAAQAKQAAARHRILQLQTTAGAQLRNSTHACMHGSNDSFHASFEHTRRRNHGHAIAATKGTNSDSQHDSAAPRKDRACLPVSPQR